MKEITLGKTGIKTPQNAFGALPIQRVTMDEAVKILQRAYEGGMTFFDTARAYSDSEEKLGQAFEGMRDKIFIASKTMAKTPDEFWKQLDISLTNLKTDYLDIYHVLIQKARGLKIHHVCKRVFLMLRGIRNYLQAELFYCRYYD